MVVAVAAKLETVQRAVLVDHLVRRMTGLAYRSSFKLPPIRLIATSLVFLLPSSPSAGIRQNKPFTM